MSAGLDNLRKGAWLYFLHEQAYRFGPLIMEYDLARFRVIMASLLMLVPLMFMFIVFLVLFMPLMKLLRMLMLMRVVVGVLGMASARRK